MKHLEASVNRNPEKQQALDTLNPLAQSITSKLLIAKNEDANQESEDDLMTSAPSLSSERSIESSINV